VLKPGAPDGPGSAREAGGVIGPPTLRALFASLLRLGRVSFGGPGMVAYIRRLAVVQRRARPRCRPPRTSDCGRGGSAAVLAYVGFGLPTFALMLVMSLAYERAVPVQAVTAALTGLRARDRVRH
jgi:hypothetical protein